MKIENIMINTEIKSSIPVDDNGYVALDEKKTESVLKSLPKYIYKGDMRIRGYLAVLKAAVEGKKGEWGKCLEEVGVSRSVADKHCSAAEVEYKTSTPIGTFKQGPLLEIYKFSADLWERILDESKTDDECHKITTSSVREAVIKIREDILGGQDQLIKNINNLFSKEERRDIAKRITAK